MSKIITEINGYNIDQILKDAWLGIVINENTLFNPLMDIPPEAKDRPELYYSWLLTRPEYLGFAAKILLNIELAPFQTCILWEMWNHKFPIVVASRGGSKTFLMAVYSMLRAVLIPKRKVVIVGSVFRQSKLVFNYIKEIYDNAPILRSIIDDEPHFSNDRCFMHLGSSKITALPVGNTGDKIRGERSTEILADEFAAQSKEIFETVIAGFGAVSSDPMTKVKQKASKTFASIYGLELEDTEDEYTKMGNQIILSGTAYYYFNHFAKYWEQWRTIIRTKGDRKKVQEFFGDREIDESFNWKDYSVVRLPADLLPPGFMDESQLARSKATLPSDLYALEFSACSLEDTDVITKKGIKQITNISVGDEVLTAKNRFKKVTELTKRFYSGPIINIKTYGYYKDINFTPDHKFYKNGGYKDLEDINDSLEYCPNFELSGLKEIDVRDYVKNYIQRDEHIYPQPGSTKLTLEEQKEIYRLNDVENLSQTEISKKLNLKFDAVHRFLKTRSRKTKSSFNPVLKVDYDLGLLFGYYASEGSCGIRTLNFALDSHVDDQLLYFINQVKQALINTFGIQPEVYTRNKKDDGSCSVCLKSRLITDFFKSLCPGNCYDKIIDHDLLFSNEDFMKGFIVGMTNGDGHKRDNLITITLSNKNLINQIKMVLEFFGIPVSFLKTKDGKSTIKGKIYNTKKAYKAELRHSYYKKFMNIFYGYNFEYDLEKSKHKQFVNKNNNIESRIKNKKIIDYNGFVYCLKVEDDESFSIPCGTVHNCFSKDSNGFFKASLIEKCTANEENDITHESGRIVFEAKIKGDKDKRYVFGVDPASEADRFAIVIIELAGDHRKIVHCWTTNTEEFKQKRKSGLIEENDFYGYTARKIRDLMILFPCDHIAIDSQGGGKAVYESLHDRTKLKQGELLLWEVIDENKERDSDGEEGLHIIELVNFASAEYTSTANHTMKKDFEDRILLFPRFNPVVAAVAAGISEENKGLYDTFEDCLEEIEELKKELSQIVVTVTTNGRERWDTPDVKISGSEKGKLRKDRYSALLMANAAARKMCGPNYIPRHDVIGLLNRQGKDNGKDFIGPSWATSKLNELYK